MPDIKGKKINQLDDGNAVVDPLFVLGDQDGKAYRLGMQDMKTNLAKITADAPMIPDNISLNTITSPGYYTLDKTIFKNNRYPFSPFGIKRGIWVPNNLLLIVTQDGAVLHQSIVFVGAKNTVVSRSYNPGGIFPRGAIDQQSGSSPGDKNLWSLWEIISGLIQIDLCYSQVLGGYTEDSIQSLSDYAVQGKYEIYPWQLNADGTSTYFHADKDHMLAIGFPDISKFISNAVYSSYTYLEVRYTASNTGMGNFIQSVYTQYGNVTIANWKSIPAVLSRVGGVSYNSLGFHGSGTFNDWLPSENLTLRVLGIGSVNAIDNQLPAGTATMPPLAFTPGVQAQNPVVKGAINYDGTDLFYIDNAGAKHKITSTIV